MSEPFVTPVAWARYLPDLFGSIALKPPPATVTTERIVRHTPETLFWTLTGTLDAHRANPSATLTFPRAVRLSLRLSDMLLAWVTVAAPNATTSTGVELSVGVPFPSWP
jgi:hypothetical protein